MGILLAHTGAIGCIGLSRWDSEIHTNIQSLKDELHEAKKEREMNCFKMQELVRSRGKLESHLNKERMRGHQLMQSAMSASMKACSAEVQVSSYVQRLLPFACRQPL